MEGPSHILRNGGLPTISTMDLALGNYAGPMGATMLLVILACALFLLHRRRIGVAAPLCFVGACLLIAFFCSRGWGRGLVHALEPPGRAGWRRPSMRWAAAAFCMRRCF